MPTVPAGASTTTSECAMHGPDCPYGPACPGNAAFQKNPFLPPGYEHAVLTDRIATALERIAASLDHLAGRAR